MANKQRRTLSEEIIGLTERGVEYLVVSVHYSKGGMNYASYNQEPRGYYLSVSPETRGGGTVSFTLFSGTKSFLEPAKAFSAKRLASLDPPAEKIAELKAHVMAKRPKQEA